MLSSFFVILFVGVYTPCGWMDGWMIDGLIGVWRRGVFPLPDCLSSAWWLMFGIASGNEGQESRNKRYTAFWIIFRTVVKLVKQSISVNSVIALSKCFFNPSLQLNFSFPTDCSLTLTLPRPPPLLSLSLIPIQEYISTSYTFPSSSTSKVSPMLP